MLTTSSSSLFTRLLLLTLTVSLSVSCSDDSEQRASCTDGQLFACPCDDGTTGTQQCQSGVFLDCQCGGVMMDASSSGMDISSGMDTSSSGMDTSSSGMDTSSSGMDTSSSGMDTSSSGMDTSSSGMDTSSSGMDTSSDMDTEGDTISIDDDPAVGFVTLSEFHSSDGGVVTSSASAGFAPEAGDGASECVRIVEGCRIPRIPDCQGTCNDQQFCTFDEDCDPVCKRICDAQCEPDEECYFPSASSPSCRTRETFDAGSLSFFGTTTALTLLPPYSFSGTDNGSLFAPESSLRVSANGARDAGLEAFDESFEATKFIDANLNSLTLSMFVGPDDIPVSWVAGEDEVVVTVSLTRDDGVTGQVICPADDPTGARDVPRAAIDAVLDGRNLQNATLSVQRTRIETREGFPTKGTLTFAEVPSTAEVSLSTTSTESKGFTGCTGVDVVCGDGCVDIMTDVNHCGGCGVSCGGDQCLSGECVAWTCAAQYYGTNDGCDCGCGSVDPDCADDSFGACQHSFCPQGSNVSIEDNSVCEPQTCGNGVIEASEMCDDGNTVNGDGCTDSCYDTDWSCSSDLFYDVTCDCGCGISDPRCADASVAACEEVHCGSNEVVVEGDNGRCLSLDGWTCDPSYLGSNDGCDCGCGILDPDCADGLVTSCQNSACPAGATPASYQNWTCHTCGDGFLEPSEMCDDGNRYEHDHCSNSCQDLRWDLLCQQLL